MQRRQWIALVYGWIVVLALIIVSSVILAFFLRFTAFNDPALSWVTLAIGLISLFIGGLVAGKKSRAKGWVIGSTVGLGFTLLIFLIQYLGYKQAFSFEQMLYHLGYIAAALVGGVLGVNTVTEES